MRKIFRNALETAPLKRKRKEVDTIIDLLREVDFFKRRSDGITADDERWLASKFRFKHIPAYYEEINTSKDDQDYYVILKGIVSVSLPNSSVTDWDSKMVTLQELRQAYLN